MKFLKRLRFYLIGVALGLLLVVMFFGKDKTYKAFFGWLPGNAKKTELLANRVIIAENLSSRFKDCIQKDSLFLEEIIEEGSVIFKKSDTRNYPKKYAVEYNGDLFYFLQLDKDTITRLEQVEGGNVICQ